MLIQLSPRQLSQIISDAKQEDLEEELRLRAAALSVGKCDHCNKPLNSKPVCSIPYRHEGRKPEDWEGICDTPRISRDRRNMHYQRDDMTSVCRSRFPCNCYDKDVMSGDHPDTKGRNRQCISHSIGGDRRIHIACDGQGCDYKFCRNGIVNMQIDFGDPELKCKWPEDVISFTVPKKKKPKKKKKST